MNAPVLSLWKGDTLVTVPNRKFTPTEIVQQVADRHQMSLAEIRSETRARRVTHARQEAMWELRQRTKLSYPQIARWVGLTDHTSAIHGVKRHAERIAGESAE